MKDKYINALIIGFIAAVIVWGVAKDNIGFAGLLIILFIAYKLFIKPKNKAK